MTVCTVGRASTFTTIDYFSRILIVIYWKRGNVAELFPCSSCEEIKTLDDSARSGLYIVKSSDGTLEQVSPQCVVETTVEYVMQWQTRLHPRKVRQEAQVSQRSRAMPRVVEYFG